MAIVALITLNDTFIYPWTRDRPVTEIATYKTNTEDRHPFLRTGFEPGILAIKQPQTHALDLAAIAISAVIMYLYTIFGKRYKK